MRTLLDSPRSKARWAPLLWTAGTLLVGCVAQLEGEDDGSGGDTGDVLIGPGSTANDTKMPVPGTSVPVAGGVVSGGTVATRPVANPPPSSAVTPPGAPIAVDAGVATVPPPPGVIAIPTQPPWYPDASVDAGWGAIDAEAACHGPVAWPASAWLSHPGFGTDIQALFDRTKNGMVGVWHGVAATPWVPPYEVDIEFRADGSYSARCSVGSNECCIAFYYGTDRDTPLKRYRVEDATLSGNVIGEIDIDFGFALAGWQGELSHIELDASGNGLRFEFARDDGYGPLKYDLRRVK